MVSFKRLSELQPSHLHAFSGAASCAVNLCDWERRAEFWPGVEAHIRNKTSVISAFAQFGYTGDPAPAAPVRLELRGAPAAADARAAVEGRKVAPRQAAHRLSLGRFPRARHGLPDGRPVRAARPLALRDVSRSRSAPTTAPRCAPVWSRPSTSSTTSTRAATSRSRRCCATARSTSRST